MALNRSSLQKPPRRSARSSPSTGPSSSASSVRSTSPAPPGTLRSTRSFTRYDSSEPAADPLSSSLARLKTESPAEEALAELEPRQEADSDDDDDGVLGPMLLPEGFDELPIEIANLADRFIDSLTKPIHPAPLSINDLSDMFQQFYGSASQAIGSHVQNTHLYLASKKGQKKIPTQMLSRAEISQKKRDRKLLEAKKIALEEAVERRVTNGVYDKLWRHKNTDDEARDESLQSKIAALKVVGVNLGHLGVEVAEDKRKGFDAQLLNAAATLAKMSEERYPLGKLALLKQAHKTIVDCLTAHLAATSADSLLPALIYTLILSPPEPPLNAISNLVFILRFRTSGFIDGEAAYCLTNFEASIAFLETVDLASLNLDNSAPLTPISSETPSKRLSLLPEEHIHQLTERLTKTQPTTATTATTSSSVLGIHVPTSSPSASLAPSTTSNERTTNTPRKLSFLTPVDLATSAVSTADQSIRNLGNTIENSYKFLFQHVPTPRTLEDARRLIESPTNTAEGVLKRKGSTDSMPSIKEGSLLGEGDRPSTARSATSPMRAPSPVAPHAAAAAAAAAVALDPIKHIGSSIGRFAAFGARGFTRSAAVTPTPTPNPASTPAVQSTGNKDSGAEVRDLLASFPELKGQLALDGSSESSSAPTPDAATKREEVEKVRVEKRFLEVKDAGELRLAEVQGLLVEYQRLVVELGKRGLV